VINNNLNILLTTLLFLIFCSFAKLPGQTPDSTSSTQTKTVKKDTTNLTKKTVVDSNATDFSIMFHKKPYFKQPTLPPLRISDKQKNFNIKVNKQDFWDHSQNTNWDALNMPTNRLDYEINREYLRPLIPITPLEVPQKVYNPLTINEIVIPTRQELDILEVLWLKEDVTDITIYSCLDTTLNITMEDLNKLLSKMERKGFVRRKIVSPRLEFNAFGIMIEMSLKNRRNRVYSYHSNVDRELMRRFINANAYLFKQDSSIVNQRQLQAALKDKTLLEDLNNKILQPQKP
jgi:hypothetical protein